MIKARSLLMAFLAALFAVAVPSAKAQTTVAIANPIPSIVGGAGVTGVYPGYTNAQLTFTLTAPADPIDLAVRVVGNPSGVTAGFVVPALAVPNNAANISNILQVTSTTNLFLSVAVSGAPKGSYGLEITASNTVSLAVVTNSTTTLVLPNVFTAASAADTNWSTDANWSLAAKPLTGDSARFEYASGATNAYFDTSVVLGSLYLMPKALNLTATNFLASGVSVAVNGANGFFAGADNFTASGNLTFNFAMAGSGSLIVTNSSAPFSMFSGVYNNVVGSRQDLSGLDTLRVDVSRVGIGDGYLMYPAIAGTKPAQMGSFLLAKTNIIRATYVGDYSGSGINMTNSIMIYNSAGNASGTASGGNPFVFLGYSNIFLADSMSVHSQQSGVDNVPVRFNPAFTANNAPIAIFRGANGGRMAYLGIAVESGGSGGANQGQFTGRTRGQGLALTNGTVDMLVDTLVLSQNQTNRNGNFTQGLLTYQIGNVDANTVRLGYRAPSDYIPVNATGVRATLTVGGLGSNAVLRVNNSLRFMEGHFTETAAGSTFARLDINNGGVAYVNTVTWGTNLSGVANPGGGSRINVNNGGHLFLTNTMCTLSEPMPLLTVGASGQLTFHVTAGVTNAFVTTLSDTAGAKINIASLSGFSPTVPATNVLIKYATATGAGAHPISIGTIPSGYNNVTLFDNAANQTIELRIQTNAPATLVWKGYVNNTWDHSTPNWLNTANNAQVAFFDADSVVFAETNSPNFKTIDVSELVLPAATYMSNSASAYALTGSGSIGGNPMIKVGTAALTNEVINGSVLQLQQGAFYGTSPSAVIGGITLSTNTLMAYAGSVTAGLTVNSGAQAALLSGGSANGPVTVSGVMTNEGTIQGGSLSVNGSGLLVNNASGTLLNIGNSGSGNVASNATLLNIGNIGAALQANSLTVNGTLKDMGVGTIYLTTLSMNSGSTFVPGGDGIGITSVKTPGVGSSFPGRIALATGSTTLIKVDFANPQTNTIVEAQSHSFGPNTSFKAFDGATILVTNINTGAGLFAAGQNFRMFRNSDNAVINLNIGNAGLNTTNRYPIVQPIFPLTNTRWDVANLIDPDPNGFIGIITFPTTGTNISYSTFVADGTNLVSHLQWPSEYTGWRLEQQSNPLSVGIANNWTTVVGSTATNEVYITNNITIPTSFFRMVYP